MMEHGKREWAGAWNENANLFYRVSGRHQAARIWNFLMVGPGFSVQWRNHHTFSPSPLFTLFLFLFFSFPSLLHWSIVDDEWSGPAELLNTIKSHRGRRKKKGVSL
jgi:hypothetical protein